jgi:hypothetical protein
MPKKVMNHGEYQASLKHKTLAELEYIKKDAAQAALNQRGWGENEGYYLDEVHYTSAEIRRRINGDK